jgi:uncharacterized protein (TIGR00369 family)
MSERFEVPPDYGPPFHHALNIRMAFGAEKEGIAWVNVDPSIHYGSRWAHGGVACALVDIASGIAIARATGSEEPSGQHRIDGTIELKVNFLRKVIDGDMTATARVVHVGRRVAVTDVDVTNRDRLCAKAIATYQLTPPKDQDRSNT